MLVPTRSSPPERQLVVALVDDEPARPPRRGGGRRVAALVAVPLVVAAAGTLAGVNAPAPLPAPAELLVPPPVVPARLFVRTAPGGARLGVYVDAAIESGFLRADVATPAAVGWAGAPLEAHLARGVEVRNAGVLGAAEGAPLSWVVVQAAPDAAVVRLIYDEGSDEMVPVEGWAVLVAPGTPESAEVVALARDNTTVGQVSFVWPAAPAPSLTLAFQRSTADLVDVLMYLGASQVVPEVAYANVVAIPGNGLLTPGAEPDPTCPLRVRGAYTLGRVEGWPAAAAVVHTAPDVAHVKAAFPDGWVDEMSPVDGWAILARAGVAEQWFIEAFDADGRLVATASGQPDDPCRA